MTMGRLLQLTEPRNITIADYPEPALRSDQVRIETLYSGISAGTQLTLYRGVNPYINSLWNADLRLFESRPAESTSYPIQGMWGYEEVGRVIETGADVHKISVGDLIYGAWGHRSSHVTDEAYACDHRLPSELDPVCGIFAQMGAIANNAILDADIHVGETVAVFGQGVPGQIIAQLARLNGARVIVVDLDDNRLAVSKQMGAEITINAATCDVGREIKQLTGRRGVDVAIEITGVASVLHEAIRSTCYNGRVVCSGFIVREGNGLFLGQEFHHNRIQVICSQISGVGLHVANRWNQVRMEQNIMALQAAGRLNLKGLITHVISYEQASEAYRMIDKQTEHSLQVVLDFQA